MRYLTCAFAAALLAAPALAERVDQPGIVSPAAIGYLDTNGVDFVPIDVLHGLPTSLLCTVVAGDQAYTLGSPAGCTMTPSGRIKVGLSSSTNVDPAAQPATTLHSDLVGCKARIGAVVWGDGYTGGMTCDGWGSIKVVQRDPAGVAPSNPGTRASGSMTAPGVGASVAVRGDFNLSLWGSGSWTCEVDRSFDGATFLPRTALDQLLTYSAVTSTVASEPEAGVLTRVNCTAVSGTVNWRISQ